jgi:hypothetical protein
VLWLTVPLLLVAAAKAKVAAVKAALAAAALPRMLLV